MVFYEKNVNLNIFKKKRKRKYIFLYQRRESLSNLKNSHFVSVGRLSGYKGGIVGVKQAFVSQVPSSSYYVIKIAIE